MDKSLRINSIHDLISMFEGWEQVQELAEHLSGVRAQLIDSSGKTVSGRESLPDICRLIQSTKVGEARCRACYEDSALKQSAARQANTVFRCHAGLENIVFPLALDGVPAGAIACGRALSPSGRPTDREFYQLAQDLGVDAGEMERAVGKLAEVDSTALEAFAKVLQPFVDAIGATIFRYFSLIEKSEDLITASKESEEMLSVDRLTGLFNRRYFTDRAASEVSRANRYGHPIALVMLELDSFEAKTDAYGLIAKDIILREVAEILTTTARSTEVAVRYNDSRFVVIMPECDHEQAFRFAERLRKNIAVKVFGQDAGLDVSLTASIGVAALYQEVTVENLVERAENALAQALNDGGNKIRLVPLQNAVIENARTAHIYVPDTTKKRRVVITGVGPIAPNGIGKEAFWNGMKNGVSGIGTITQFESPDIPIKIAAEVNDFSPEAYMSPKEARRMDRFSQFAVAASRMAIEDSRIDLKRIEAGRIGVATGTAIGGFPFGARENLILHNEGYKKMSPFLAMALVFGASSSQVSIDLGITGPSTTFSTGCNSGADATSYAYDLIERGDLDAVIVGGTEACIIPTVVAAFAHLRALSSRNDQPQKASRPFDLDRDGFVLGEAAGFLVVEELEHARNRDAHIYCEIAGYGMTCDAYHMTRPEPSGAGMYTSMETALKKANLQPGEIDYINAHGSSTPLNDMIETKAIRRLFEGSTSSVSVSSTKSMIGHSVGAPGAVELIVTALAMENNFMPPTINYENPDPDCDLDYVPNVGRSKVINAAISNSFSFGGKNTVLAVKKLREATA